MFLSSFKSLSGRNEHVEQIYRDWETQRSLWRCKSYSLWRNKRLRKRSIFRNRRWNKFLFWKPRQMFLISGKLCSFSAELINFELQRPSDICSLRLFDERFTRNFFFFFVVPRSIRRFLQADDIAALEGFQIDNLSLISLQRWSQAQFKADENKQVYFQTLYTWLIFA